MKTTKKLYRCLFLRSNVIIHMPADAIAIEMPDDMVQDYPAKLEEEVEVGEGAVVLAEGTYISTLDQSPAVLSGVVRLLKDVRPGATVLLQTSELSGQEMMLWPCVVRPGEVGPAGDVVEAGGQTYSLICGEEDWLEGPTGVSSLVSVAFTVKVKTAGSAWGVYGAHVKDGRLVLGEVPELEAMRLPPYVMRRPLPLPDKVLEAVRQKFEVDLGLAKAAEPAPEPKDDGEPPPLFMAHAYGWPFLVSSEEEGATLGGKDIDDHYQCIMYYEDALLIISRKKVPNLPVGWTAKPLKLPVGAFLADDTTGYSAAVHKVDAAGRVLLSIAL